MCKEQRVAARGHCKHRLDWPALGSVWGMTGRERVDTGDQEVLRKASGRCSDCRRCRQAWGPGVGVSRVVALELRACVWSPAQGTDGGEQGVGDALESGQQGGLTEGTGRDGPVR